MRFFAVFAVCSLALTWAAGCSSESASPSPTPQEAEETNDSAATAERQATTADPTEVVARFLDSFRRGGGDGEAATLLTKAAREQCERLQLMVQPMGTPEATFSVTRSEVVPGREDAALVHSIWTEPSAEGEPQTFQVVWAVKREAKEWRISGLALDVAAGEEPLVIDFESSEDLTRHFGGSAPPTETAQLPDAIQR